MLRIGGVIIVVYIIIDHKRDIVYGVVLDKAARRIAYTVRATDDSAEVAVCLNGGVLDQTVSDPDGYGVSADRARLVAVIAVLGFADYGRVDDLTVVDGRSVA